MKVAYKSLGLSLFGRIYAGVNFGGKNYCAKTKTKIKNINILTYRINID